MSKGSSADIDTEFDIRFGLLFCSGYLERNGVQQHRKQQAGPEG